MVNYDDFIGSVKAFHKENVNSKGEKDYRVILSRTDLWTDLDSIKESHVRDILLKFLNSWKCRLSDKCIPGLTRALKEVAPSVEALREAGARIEDVDFDGRIGVGGETMTVRYVTERVFSRIAGVRAGNRTVAFTATSKILHLLLPDFFVLGDDNIREYYGCTGNGAGFLNFQWRMQALAKGVLEQEALRSGCSVQHAKGRLLTKIGYPVTLPRLLDMYNYQEYGGEGD